MEGDALDKYVNVLNQVIKKDNVYNIFDASLESH